MDLKIKIQEYLTLLEKDKQDIKELFNNWMELCRFQEQERGVEALGRIFDSVINKIKIMDNTLTNDLEKNYDNFFEFFKAGLGGGVDCYKEIQDFILHMKSLDDERKKEVVKGIDKENVTLENLGMLADEVYFLKLNKLVFKFYEDMKNIVDDVFNYADELYIHHTGDKLFAGTRNAE